MQNKNNDKTFVQSRPVSGFSKAMSVWDAFFYNFLTMGVIFPWTFLWGPASFPGGNVQLAILITLIIQIPISLAYSFLSTTLPVSGGDYIFQKRAFGKWGFIVVMSGFVIWILQWVALSGWLFATLGLAPLFLCLGVYTNNPSLTQMGMSIQSPFGILFVSILLALFTTVFLTRGMRLYVKIQKYLFAFTLIAISIVIYVFAFKSNNFNLNLNNFVANLIHQINLKVPQGLTHNFTEFIKTDVQKHGFNLKPSFSWLATLGIVPIVWTSLQWATYSVEQSDEIAEANKFYKQLFMLLGSAVAVAGFLILIAHFENQATSSEFVLAASASYWGQAASPETITIVKSVIQPFPNILAMAASGSILISIFISLGFIANSFQITCNCFIGVTRILYAMGTDGLLPRKLSLETIDPIRHVPVRAHWFYFFASLPVIIGYSLISEWSTYSLGVTFACGYVFVFSTLAATRIPTKMKTEWSNSEIHSFPAWLIKSISYFGFILGMAILFAYLLLPQLGVTGDIANFVVIGIFVLSYLLYWNASRKSSLVEKEYK